MDQDVLKILNPKANKLPKNPEDSGCGGLSTGLIQAGFQPLLLVDNNSDCCKTLKENHREYADAVIKASITDVNFSNYENIDLDLLAGGIPCQSFSHAGKRLGLDDPRGDLLLSFIKIIDQVKPRCFLIENVKGLTTHDNGKTFKTILELLDSIAEKSYNIVWKLLNANHYGVPQKRERVFIVGTRKDIPIFKFPEELLPYPLLKDVLFDVPESAGSSYSEEKKRLFEMIPQGGCWINLPEELQREYLGNSYSSGGGKRGILHRLSMNKPSLTLMCTPTQKQTERCHPTETRPLTIREYARIQTFSDDYQFVGSISFTI